MRCTGQGVESFSAEFGCFVNGGKEVVRTVRIYTNDGKMAVRLVLCCVPAPVLRGVSVAVLTTARWPCVWSCVAQHFLCCV